MEIVWITDNAFSMTFKKDANFTEEDALEECYKFVMEHNIKIYKARSFEDNEQWSMVIIVETE